MKRREFVKNISLASASIPIFLNGLKLDIFSDSLFETNDDRVLVLIRLNGGNDGLNTIIPLNYYENLYKHRPNVLIPEKSILKLTDKNGFHPSFSGMKKIFDENKLGIIQNVGYKNQNRSHFRSMDIWSRAITDPAVTSGWLGRYFESQHDNFPEDFPNEKFPHPFAISMGYEVSATCQGHTGNFSHTVTETGKNSELELSKSSNDLSYFGRNMDFLETIIRQTNSYDKEINRAAEKGNSNSAIYDLKNPLSIYLSQVARLISGGLNTKIYILNLNGFDTHGGQLENIDTTKGQHAELLKTLSDAIFSFQSDLEKQGIDNRVLGMTFSEFGRQIAMNENNGTDHGDAGPLFLFGKEVKEGIIGSNPVINSEIEPQAGIPFEIDFRDIYASILKSWFKVSETEIKSLFEKEIKYYDILKS